MVMPGLSLIVIAAVGGLLVGSFANVCIHRLPRMQSIVFPGSRCPECGAPIAPWDNIPVISWLWLGAKCRSCRARISVRYPAVELFNAVLWVAAARGALSAIDFAAAATFSTTCLILVYVDYDFQLLPDVLTIPLAAAGFAFSLFSPRIGWRGSLLGLAAGAGILWLVASAYKALTGVEGMGMGDVKMLGAIGAFTGLAGVVLTILLASLSGSLVGLALMRRGGGWKTRLPFGVFLGAAGVCAFYEAAPLFAWYRSLLP